MGRVWTIATPYREVLWKLREYHERWNVKCVEMEAGSVFALCKYYGVECAAVLVVSDKVYPRHIMAFHEKEVLEAQEKIIPEIVEKFLERRQGF